MVAADYVTWQVPRRRDKVRVLLPGHGGDRFTRHLRTTRLANVRVINGSDGKKTGGRRRDKGIIFFTDTWQVGSE